MSSGGKESSSQSPAAALLGKVTALFRLWRQRQGTSPAAESEEDAKPCCGGVVHIAYRGASDDHLYVAYTRKWTEVKFFKPRGLRVFCAGCRRRLL